VQLFINISTNAAPIFQSMKESQHSYLLNKNHIQ